MTRPIDNGPVAAARAIATIRFVIAHPLAMGRRRTGPVCMRRNTRVRAYVVHVCIAIVFVYK